MKTSLYAIFSKRYYATIGYRLFYGCLFAAMTMGAAAVLKMISPNWNVVIAEYLYSSLTGIAYIYMLVALLANGLSMFFVPTSLCPDGMRNNRWYLMGKLGVSTVRVVTARWSVCVSSAVMSYMIGFVLSVGLGSLLLFPFDSEQLGFAAKTAVVGVLILLAVITVTMALAALVKNRLLVRFVALLTNAGWLYWFNCENLFDTMERLNVESVFARMCSVGLTSVVVLVPCLVVIGFLLMVLLIRCREYAEEGLDEDALKRLGVEADVLVLEQGTHKFNVMVSGPELHGMEDHIEVPLPDGAPPKKNKSRAAKESAE